MVQAVMQAMGSDGERQMKLCLLTRRSPPSVRPQFLTGCGLVSVHGPGVGDPWHRGRMDQWTDSGRKETR